MVATAKYLAGGLKNIGSKIAGSIVGKAASNAASKIAGSKVGQTVSGFVKGKASSVKTFMNNSTVVNKVKSGVNNFMTNTQAGKGLVKAGNSIKTAYTNADASKSVLARTVTGIRNVGTKIKNADIDMKQLGRTAMTAASVGVGYSQVISSNRQYKDSVKRTEAYNAALKAEEDAATAATNAATASSNARYDSYTAALSQGSISTQNIYSSGYAGDSVFSSTLKNSKYTLF